MYQHLTIHPHFPADRAAAKHLQLCTSVAAPFATPDSSAPGRRKAGGAAGAGAGGHPRRGRITSLPENVEVLLMNQCFSPQGGGQAGGAAGAGAGGHPRRPPDAGVCEHATPRGPAVAAAAGGGHPCHLCLRNVGPGFAFSVSKSACFRLEICLSFWETYGTTWTCCRSCYKLKALLPPTSTARWTRCVTYHIFCQTGKRTCIVIAGRGGMPARWTRVGRISGLTCPVGCPRRRRIAGVDLGLMRFS